MDTNNTSNITDPTSQGDPNGNPPVQGTNSPSHGDQSSHTEELKQKIADLERDNRKYRQERKQQEEAAAQAEQQRLQEQGEFKALAEKHEARVQELEPIAQDYADLSLLVAGQIEQQIKDWPAEILVTDPGNDAPVKDRLAWIAKIKPAVEKLQGIAARPGNSPNPKASNPTNEDQQKKYMDNLRRSGKYGA